MPRIGAGLALALQLILWGRFLDIAVRDLMMALGGALTLARLTPFAERSSNQPSAFSDQR